MSILFGHPTGNPNAHQAALAHFEAGRLAGFCVSWAPAPLTLDILARLPGLRPWAQRLARRRFAPLAGAPLIQGRAREWLRLAGRLIRDDDDRFVQDTNDWLMRTMQRACRRPDVTAVHSYEDCSLWPFEQAKRQGKACIYDMPIGYYPALQPLSDALHRDYADWLPARAEASFRDVRLAQKKREMELADLVLAPSVCVQQSIQRFFPDKPVVLAPYGVDLAFWTPTRQRTPAGKLRFIVAGQISVRKGIPALIEAWNKAALRDAELELVGSWRLSDRARALLPPTIIPRPPCDPGRLREYYRAADVTIFPSFSEGFGLALVEAMACGLPVLTFGAGVAPEAVTPDCGRILPAGNVDALVDGLRWCAAHRDALAAMGKAAREQAELFSWTRYRRIVTQAVSPYV